MILLSTLLVIIAFGCALCGAFGWSFGSRTPNWIALALAFYFASLLLHTISVR